MSDEIPLIILVAFTILAFIVTLILGYRRWQQVKAPSVQLSSGTLNSLCTQDSQCQKEYNCDVARGVCKLPLGATCGSGSQCVFPAFCSGVCVSGSNGTLNTFCPCGNGLLCISTTEANYCKGNSLYICKSNSDCANGRCFDGKCALGNPDAFYCSKNDACVAGSGCDEYHYCQKEGVVSGTVGAACFSNAPPPGSAISTTVGCNPGNKCVGGVCVAS